MPRPAAAAVFQPRLPLAASSSAASAASAASFCCRSSREARRTSFSCISSSLSGGGGGTWSVIVFYVLHGPVRRVPRSEEHTSELQSLMRISYAVFYLQKKTTTTN